MRFVGFGVLILLAAAIATFGCIATYGAYYIRFRWNHSTQGAIEVSLLAVIALLSFLLAVQVGIAAFSLVKSR